MLSVKQSNGNTNLKNINLKLQILSNYTKFILFIASSQFSIFVMLPTLYLKVKGLRMVSQLSQPKTCYQFRLAGVHSALLDGNKYIFI